MRKSIVIAIDGPSGSGKSSTSRALANLGGFEYLDTGALYRAATIVLGSYPNLPTNEIANCLAKAQIELSADPKNPVVLINGKDVSKEIRTKTITDSVSQVSAIPEVRAFLFQLQRSLIDKSKRGIVVEGRDIGTVVAPDADLKIYLSADLRARSMRRESELADMKLLEIDQEVSQELEERDAFDSSRAISPLRQADDAVVVDSTLLSLDETVEYIWNIMKQRGLIGIPTVVIVGRPNVGKSTLVNRILGSKDAIIEDTPGVTRDRVRYETEWNGKKFCLVDTGGWLPSGEGIEIKIAEAAAASIHDADLVLFVVDAKVGIQSDDLALVELLRKSQRKTLLIGNKVDSDKDEFDAHSLWNLGLGEPIFVSAAHGRGSGDLLDSVVNLLPEFGKTLRSESSRRIAIVGKPNVGKSSLLNSFAGQTRALVDDAEGTTRDPIDEIVEIDGKSWRFIDTAGIRRRSHQADGIDYFATLRTERAINDSECVIIVIDASQPMTEQDLRIISLAEDSGKALLVCMNKWDLLDEDRRAQLDREMDRNLDQVEWAEQINVSAKTGWHRDRLIPAVERALDGWETRIPTAKLNAFLGQLVGANPPPVRSGKQPKILFATQAGIAPPTFVIFSSDFLEPSYRRFIERRLREEFGFQGTPVRISVRLRK
ncbi:MAG: ribosome biogenesis GTPase Der [Candidatus Nanopelagicaceae bacterium]